ncbi:MAG: hypothetical protein RIQ56_379 [Candidatus Parcubacteria bacterium]|jgi:hypothetical protein
MSIVRKKVKVTIGEALLSVLASRECYYGFQELYHALSAQRLSATYKGAHKALKILIRKGYARKAGSERIHITELGRALHLQRSRGPGDLFPIRSHDLLFRCPILRRSSGAFEDGWFSLNDGVRNWKQYYREFSQNIHVQVSRTQVTVRIREIVCPDVDLAMMTAFDYVLQVLSEIHHRYPGLQVGLPSRVCDILKQHHAINAKEISQFIREYGIKYKDDRIHIDYSTGKLPEIEFVHPLHAQGDMQRLIDFFRDIVEGKYEWRK